MTYKYKKTNQLTKKHVFKFKNAKIYIFLIYETWIDFSWNNIR